MLAAFFSLPVHCNASVSGGVHGLKYERPELTGNALDLMSLSALHARCSGLMVAVMDLEVLFPGLLKRSV